MQKEHFAVLNTFVPMIASGVGMGSKFTAYTNNVPPVRLVQGDDDFFGHYRSLDPDFVSMQVSVILYTIAEKANLSQSDSFMPSRTLRHLVSSNSLVFILLPSCC